MAAKKTARHKAKKTKKGRQRSDDLKNFWRGARSPVRFGDDQWRVTVLRGRTQKPLDVSDLTESIEWTDNGPILTGAVALRKPQFHSNLDITEGHQVKLEHRHIGRGHWTELWRMRLGGADDTTGTSGTSGGVVISPGDGTYQFNLADDLTLVSRTKADFKVNKSKNKKGERVDLALRRFCRQQHLPYKPFPQMHHYIKKMSFHRRSQLDILQTLIRHENNNARRNFTIRWRAGRIEAIREQRSAFMDQFSDTITSATLTRQQRAGFATVVKVDATAEKGKGKDAHGKNKHKKHHIHATVSRRALVQRYGRIVKTIHVKANSVAEARKKGRQHLAKQTRPRDAVSFTHPGVPALRRWAACHIDFPEQHFSELCYVSAVHHSVSSGDYTMDVDVQFTDPYAKTKAKKKDEKKKKTAAKRRRKTKGKRGRRTHPKPRKARQRRDHTSAKTPSTPRHGLTPGQQLSQRGLR